MIKSKASVLAGILLSISQAGFVHAEAGDTNAGFRPHSKNGMFNYLFNYSNVESGPDTVVGRIDSIADPEGFYSYRPVSYFYNYNILNLSSGPGVFKPVKADAAKDFENYPVEVSYPVIPTILGEEPYERLNGQVVIGRLGSYSISDDPYVEELIRPVGFEYTKTYDSYRVKKLDVSESVIPLLMLNSRIEQTSGRVIKVERAMNLNPATNTCYVTLHEGGGKQGYGSWSYDRPINYKERIRQKQVARRFDKTVKGHEKAYQAQVDQLNKKYAAEVKKIERKNVENQKQGLPLEPLPEKPVLPAMETLQEPYEVVMSQYPERPNVNTFVVISEDVCRFAEDAATALEPVIVDFVAQAEERNDYITTIMLQRFKDHESNR